MQTTDQALLTVVFPVFHLRAGLAECVRSWTKGQKIDRKRYRVIVAAPANTADLSEDDVKALLGEGDVFLRVAGGDVDTALWNAGAAQATTPWLVITEGHCSAQPDCLAVLERWIAANPDAHVGNFDATHPGADIVGRLTERWFNEIHAEWQRRWPRLRRAGFAIRADVFHAACSFEAEYREFAMPMLSARLNARGVEIADVPDAVVIHHDEHSMRERHDTIADYIRNEIQARGRNDPAFFERYFGFSPQWCNQVIEGGAGARRMARALIEAATTSPRRSRRLWRRFAALAVRSCLGAERRIALRRAAMIWNEIAVESLPLPRSLKWTRFIRGLDHLLDLEQIKSLSLYPARGSMSGAFWRAEDIGPQAISGVFQLETHGQRVFRWTMPGAMVRLPPQPSACELVIDTGGLRGDPADALPTVVVGRRPLPGQFISSAGDDLVIRLPDDLAKAAGEGIFVFSAPLRPRQYGRDDDRELGLPVFSIGWRPVAAV